MYFPEDPLFAYDPIMNSVPDEAGRRRLDALFDVTSYLGSAPALVERALQRAAGAPP